jgi:hypothetical protein
LGQDTQSFRDSCLVPIPLQLDYVDTLSTACEAAAWHVVCGEEYVVVAIPPLDESDAD